MKQRSVTVNDRMQQGYRYVLVAPVGRNIDPGFRPDLTPSEMLRLGVFGGKYMTDCRDEFPRSWFARAKLSPKQADASVNFFGVSASQPLSVWRSKGWIHPDDPRGWFQWYCRYYLGRRLPDEDARQIKRWKAIQRHVRQLQMNRERGDVFSPETSTASSAALGVRQPQALTSEYKSASRAGIWPVQKHGTDHENPRGTGRGDIVGPCR